MADEVFLTSDLDSPDDETIDRLCKAMSDPGVIYYDQENDSFIFTDTDRGGNLTARRLLPPLTLGQAVLDRGIVRLAQERGRGGANAAPRFTFGPYERFITRLPLLAPHKLSFPHVRGLYRLPAVVLDDGQLVQAWPGVNRDMHLLFVNSMVEQGRVADASPDYPHLNKWLSAIEFTDEKFRGNLLGYILSCLCRPILPEFPFLVLDATSRKQGKTTVASAVGYLLLGETASMMTHTGDEQELEKRIAGSCGNPGPNILFLDNVRPKRGQSGVIRSQFLAAAATSPCVKVRPVYGRRAEPVDYPITMLTMNEAQVESDLHDRSVRVVLTGKPGRYFSPNPYKYAQRHRLDLLAEAVHLLTSLDLTEEFTPITRMGDWEQIATFAARKLGLETDYDPDAVDTPDAAVKELVSLIRELSDNTTESVPFVELANQLQLNRDALPELFGLVRRTNATTAATRGHAIRRFVDSLEDRRINVGGERVRFVQTKLPSGCIGVSVA